MSAEGVERRGRRDALWLGVWLAVLLVECVYLAHGRQPWSDEIFGRTVAYDPSLRHMLFAWRSGADGGGVFFYFAARVWGSVFGHSIAALRLFTAIGMWVGLALAWLAARQWYRLGVVAFALPFVWLTAHSVLRQLMIGRFYGMLVAAAAAAVYAYAAGAERKDTGPWLLAGVFAAHCVLVGTHPFGLLYSAAVLAATVALDATRRWWRPKLYLAALAGWWILWPSRFALRASAAVGKPHFWTTTPKLDELPDGLVFWTDEIQWLALMLFVAVVGLAVYRKVRQREAALQGDRAAWLMGFALMAVVPLVWVRSQWGTSYFVDRYLLPAVMGAALLVCAALQRLIPARRPAWAQWALAAAVLAVAFGTGWGMFNDATVYAEPPHAYTAALAGLVPRGVPVVVERVDVFAEAAEAEPEVLWRYLLDWETVLLPASPRGEVSGYHEMESWQRVGYHAGAIQPYAPFLAGEREFWVVSDAKELWFARRVQGHPEFTVDRMGEVAREGEVETVWRVRRVPG